VYQAIKARVVAYAFPQGQRIYLEPIAEELGVSTRPVRRALNRLVAEDLVIKAPRRGFIAMTLSENDLMGQYAVTRLTLSDELRKIEPAARKRLPEFEPIASVLIRLRRSVHSNSESLASRTGEIFAHIAGLNEDAKAFRSIDRANDRLYYIRTLECQRLDSVQNELIRICELLLAGRCEELISAIHAYHDQRVALLPTLLEFPTE
jgi:DNA-binding GntR family transcriptional regulator